MFRFYDVLGGAVKVNGVDVRSLKQRSLRETIGVVPQAASMFNDTIRANILYGKQDATEEELLQAAKDAQLLDFIESLDDKWETLVGDRGLKLSGVSLSIFQSRIFHVGVLCNQRLTDGHLIPAYTGRKAKSCHCQMFASKSAHCNAG